MKLRSLHFKLIWTHSAAIALAWIGIGLARYSLVSYRSHVNYDEDLLRDGQAFVSRLQSGPTYFTWAWEGLSPKDQLSIRELEPYFVVTDSRGRFLCGDHYSEYMQTMISRGDLKAILTQTSGFGTILAADGSEYRFVNLPLSSRAWNEPAIAHIGPGGPSRHPDRSPHRADAGRQSRVIAALRLHGDRRRGAPGGAARGTEQDVRHHRLGQR